MPSGADGAALLRRMVAADTHPCLSNEDLLALLDLFAVKNDAGTVTGYQYARAAAEGWRWKAGQASACFDIATGDQRLSRQQVFAACMDMAARYGRMDSGSTEVITLAALPSDAPTVLVL